MYCKLKIKFLAVIFMKKIICLAFAFLILFFASAEAADKKPLRLVQLPIIFQSRQPDYDTCAVLETKITRAMNIPLNGTLKLVEYVNNSESTSALNEIWRGMRKENPKAKLVDAMKPLAEKINADIIVCPVLRRYSQTSVQRTLNLETYLVSNVSATLIVYDRRTDELIEKKDSRSFNSSYNKFGTASSLAKECFDRLIDAAKLKQKIIGIK